MVPRIRLTSHTARSNVFVHIHIWHSATNSIIVRHSVVLQIRRYVVFWPSTRANMPFQSDAPEGSDISQLPVTERNRVGGIWWMKWDKVKKKIPWYTHRLIHWKRVTCELHDSYFRLMTIKHAIPRIEWAIEWALNYYITQARQEVRQSEL